jgi:hypothetical protein
VAFLCPKFSFYDFTHTGIFNEYYNIQNIKSSTTTYSPNLNPPTQNSPTQQVEVGTEANVTDRMPTKTKALTAKRLANTNMNYQQWLEVRKQGIGSSDAATACGLNPICRCWNCG